MSTRATIQSALPLPVLLALGMLATPWLGAAPPAVGAKRPNIVFIMVDTLRADHVGCYGYQRPTTPNLDRLASQGARFQQMVSASSWTMPAVGTMFTGLYPSQHGLTSPRNQLAPNTVTLAVALRKDGYRTFGFTGNPLVHSRSGYGRGFDLYDDFTIILAADLNLFQETAVKPGNGPAPGDAGPARGGVTSPMVNGFAERFLLKQRGSDKPFFLFLLYFDPHADYTPPPPYDTMFAGGLPSSAIGTGVCRRGPDHPYTQEERKQLVGLYDGEIRHTDEHIGKVLASLDRLGLRDNTIVVAVSDHGEEFWDHGGMLHGHTFHEELVRVPCIIRYPGKLPAGKVIRGQAMHLDLMPTLLDLAGVPVPAQCEGQSLAGALRDPTVPVPERIAFLEGVPDSPTRLTAARLPARKLVHDDVANTAVAFDLVADPQETRPLLSPPFPLRPRLADWRDQMARSAAQRRAANPVPAVLDEAYIQRLKTLGYLR